MKESDVEKYKVLRLELEKDIFLKLEKIKEKILTHSDGTVRENIQILVMVNEELEDVLLNWEPSVIPFFNSDFDLDDDDY